MSGLLDLVASAPEGTEKVLQAFALAEALTDPVAEKIYQIVPLAGVSYSEFRAAIAYSNIVEPRNSEWNIERAARAELIERSTLSPEDTDAVHEALLLAAREGNPDNAGWETPHYLFTDAGLAFHTAALGLTDQALYHYSQSAIGSYGGNQWLAVNFAIRQEAAGLIPGDAIETLFLKAMVLFRTGKRKAALPLLRRVASSERSRHEVAIALHIVGNADARLGHYREAEAAYKRSIEIDDHLNNRFGIAQVEHSMANMFAKQGRFKEAEAAYKRSIGMRGELNDLFGLAQTEHSMANMYAKQERFEEAEAAYQRSIDMRGELNDLFGLAQTEHSMANMYAKQERFAEAEAAYQRSIENGKAINHRHHVAQTEHSLANMYAKQERFEEAEALFDRSIATLRTLDDKNGMAQTLRSRGLAIGLRNPALAMRYLTESLQLNETIHNQFGIDIVRKTIERFSRQRSKLGEQPD